MTTQTTHRYAAIVKPLDRASFTTVLQATDFADAAAQLSAQYGSVIVSNLRHLPTYESVTTHELQNGDTVSFLDGVDLILSHRHTYESHNPTQYNPVVRFHGTPTDMEALRALATHNDIADFCLHFIEEDGYWGVQGNGLARWGRRID